MRRKIFIPSVCTVLALCMLPISAATPQGVGLSDVSLDENALYNGIVLPDDYTVSTSPLDGYEAEVPYLLSKAQGGYKPNIVNIDVGRQLFVDDFLIGETNLTQTYHQATLYDAPVLSRNDTGVGNGTAANSGGVWYDMEEKIYKMWYGQSFGNTIAYATSTDGINWEFPKVGADGSNIVYSKPSDSYSIWLDYDAPKSERYKMMVRSPNDIADNLEKDNIIKTANIYTSSNGISWVNKGETGEMGDRTTFFQNWFTKDWIFSIRWQEEKSAWGNNVDSRRARYYHSGKTFEDAAKWEWETDNSPSFWMKTDASDTKDSYFGDKYIPQMYNFDSIAYESVMLGMYEIWYGPYNTIVTASGVPKITELQASFSRDGFNYDRPVRGAGKALISASRQSGDWDYGYLQSTTGGLIVYDDEIRIYYSAFSGSYEEGGQKYYGGYYGGAVGVASLRRDGFASMDGSGTLTTVPLTVTKDVKYLFVNAKTDGGSLKAEILDTNGNVLDGYSFEDCNAMSTDSCCYALSWNDAEDLSFLKGKGFKISFSMDNGELYSFWLSADPEGASGGAVGAGYAGTKNLNPDLSDDAAESNTDTQINKENKGDDNILMPVIIAVVVGVIVLSAAAMLVILIVKKRKSNIQS